MKKMQEKLFYDFLISIKELNLSEETKFHLLNYICHVPSLAFFKDIQYVLEEFKTKKQEKEVCL